MELDLENPLPNIDDFQFSPSLFLLETDHMPGDDYSKTLKDKDLDVSVRRQAIASISQLCCNSDPFLSYLAVNYLDRFLASHGMPQPKPWVVKLIAVSCVSLAIKMRRTEPSLCDLVFQGDGGLVSDKRTIDRMECIILGALKWRMRSITPFSFLSFFAPLFKLQDHASKQALKARAIQIILTAQMDIEVLDFKPSVIAASALMSASRELFPLHFPCFEDSISNWSEADKDKLWNCYGLVQEMLAEAEGYDESGLDRFPSSNTPVNVLDVQFSSSESEMTRDAMIQESERWMKRRRVNDAPDDRKVRSDPRVLSRSCGPFESDRSRCF